MYVQGGEGRGGEGRGGEGRGEHTYYILPHITYTAYHHFHPCVFLCVPVTHLYADISVTTMSLM